MLLSSHYCTLSESEYLLHPEPEKKPEVANRPISPKDIELFQLELRSEQLLAESKNLFQDNLDSFKRVGYGILANWVLFCVVFGVVLQDIGVIIFITALCIAIYLIMHIDHYHFYKHIAKPVLDLPSIFELPHEKS